MHTHYCKSLSFISFSSDLKYSKVMTVTSYRVRELFKVQTELYDLMTRVFDGFWLTSLAEREFMTNLHKSL